MNIIHTHQRGYRTEIIHCKASSKHARRAFRCVLIFDRTRVCVCVCRKSIPHPPTHNSLCFQFCNKFRIFKFYHSASFQHQSSPEGGKLISSAHRLYWASRRIYSSSFLFCSLAPSPTSPLVLIVQHMSNYRSIRGAAVLERSGFTM